MIYRRRRRRVPRRTKPSKERDAQRQLEIACRHHFGPKGDMTPQQIARLRGIPHFPDGVEGPRGLIW